MKTLTLVLWLSPPKNIKQNKTNKQTNKNKIHQSDNKRQHTPWSFVFEGQ